MPTNVTFDSLTDDISNYLERGGSLLTDPTVTVQIGRLVNAAERRIAQTLKLQGQIEVLASVPPNGLQASNPVVAKPDRWRQTVSINYGAGDGGNTRTPLFPRSYEYCRYFWPDSTQTGPPQFYCDYQISHWLIAPTPDQAYPFEVIAYMQPPLLDAVTQTNFFTNLVPNLLLKTALLETAIFLKDYDRIPTWQAQIQEELATLTQQDMGKLIDRSAIRERP